MGGFAFLLPLLAALLSTEITMVSSAKQQLKLSDSYLPVAMQVIAHLTDQMTYESKDEPAKPANKPTKPPTLITKPPTKPAAFPTKPPAFPTNPPGFSTKPPAFPAKPPTWTTAKPLYVVQSLYDGSFLSYKDGWRMSYSTFLSCRQLMLKPCYRWTYKECNRLCNRDQTTSHHRPGLYAPVAPPKPSDRIVQAYLLPVEDTTFTVISPKETKTEETFLKLEDQDIKPLVEPKPGQDKLLPPIDGKQLKSSEIFIDDELITDDELQYLSPELRDMIKMAHDGEERLIERALDDKLHAAKGKLSQANLRLMLLYDLLSRDAKKQRLNDYDGFSASLMRELVESANGGAREQLKFTLSKMVDRKDCTHEYANNRAKEMIAELARDEAGLTNEVRYLRPLVYRE